MIAVYIDAQNAHRATLSLGWKIDWKKFFYYLKNKYHATIIYFAVGHIDSNVSFYTFLSEIGYTLLFKKTLILPNGEIKGNVDIDIAIRASFDICEGGLKKAYLVSNDGDYNTLIDVFRERNIFGLVITPNFHKASKLLKQSSGAYIHDMQRIRHLIEKQKDSG